MTAFVTCIDQQQPPHHQRRRSSHESILSGLFSEAASVSSGRCLTSTAAGESSLSNLIDLCARQEDEQAEEHFVVNAVKSNNNNNSSMSVKDDEDDELSLDLGTDQGASDASVDVRSSKERLGLNLPVAEVGENGPSAPPSSSSIEKDNTTNEDKTNNNNNNNNNNNSNNNNSNSNSNTERSPIVDTVGLAVVGATSSPMSSDSNFAADDNEESMSIGHEGTAPLSCPPTSADAKSDEQQAFDQHRRRNQRNEHYVACADDFLFDDDDDDDDDDEEET